MGVNMRLIDADKLVEVCRKGWKLFGRENEKLKHWVDEYDINAQPTVEAIPIDWMYEWRIKNNEQYNVGVSSFSQMIRDWEKENDQNKKNTSQAD